jgi:hypothetical protein
MKTIMISNKPKSAEQIMNGKKTIEFRKFYIEPPFKVVNYETKGIDYDRIIDIADGDMQGKFIYYKGSGKVAFEYVVNKVDRYEYDKEKIMGEGYFGLYYDELKKACLTFDEALVYGNKKDLYGFIISDLKIYDKPKELGEFITKCKYYDPWYMSSACSDSDCPYLKIKYGDNGKEMRCGCNGEKAITRPPQNLYILGRRRDD